MTSTDRAFIAAMQKSSAMSASFTPTSAPGPHFTTSAARAVAAPSAPKAAPLSQHLARRRMPTAKQATPSTITAPIGPFAAALEVEMLSWPAVAQQLAHAGREGLVGLLTTLAQRRPEGTPIVAIVGVRPGVGATTLLLALARVVASVGGSTAIVDLTARTGAAAQLGVRRSVKQQTTSQSIDDLAVYSREEQLSVVALGPSAPPAAIARACERLATAHELVLIDAGGPADAAVLLGDDVHVVLADVTPSDVRAIAAAQAELAAIDIAGVVETFAPLA